MPERIGRDFDHASIHNRDLVGAAGYLDARSLPAPGRVLGDWRHHAREATAARVQELGYDVVGERPELAGAAAGGPNELVGALLVARYGYRVATVVRVDGCSEIYPAWQTTTRLQ